ncbi:hypothetical protein RJT34_18837 [Clitoria ternatea]|uniref:Secreted protein n=1 Tax=Clitoria ternatea TaxID=43366 RepID=A0AAN9IQA3_CLITE
MAMQLIASSCLSLLLLLQNVTFLHCLATKSGLEGDLFIVHSLLEMYVELGCLEQVSDHKDVVLWSVVINGVAKKERHLEAGKLNYS